MTVVVAIFRERSNLLARSLHVSLLHLPLYFLVRDYFVIFVNGDLGPRFEFAKFGVSKQNYGIRGYYCFVPFIVYGVSSINISALSLLCWGIT